MIMRFFNWFFAGRISKPAAKPGADDTDISGACSARPGLVVEKLENPVLMLPEGRETVLGRQIERIATECHPGCGCYYEIYEARVLRALRSLRRRLSGYDLSVFERLAPAMGWDLSDEYFDAACKAEEEVFAEVRANQE